MATRDLTSYRLECRRLLHDATGKFWTDAELNDYINDARDRVAADTGCVRSLISCYLSRGVEQYPIGGITGGLITNGGAGYTFANVTITGDGTGATATAVIATNPSPAGGGQIISVQAGGGVFYTGSPTLVISGSGLGATAICYVHMTNLPSLINGGAGYTVGDALTGSGGTSIQPLTFLVSTVAAGVITGLVTTSAGAYSAIPGGNINLTGGTGAGAILTAPTWAIGPAYVTNPGSGYSTGTTVAVSGGGGVGGQAVAVVGPVTGLGTVSSLIMLNPGSGYTQATLSFSGDGSGASAIITAIPAGTLDMMNISPVWGGMRPPCNYMPWTEFNAKARLFMSTPQSCPRVWSRYGTSGGSAFMQPVPDQSYLTEFDTAILPPLLVGDTMPETLIYPFTTPVAYYACWKAKAKQQAFGEGEIFLRAYTQKVMEAQAAVQMRRVPNPYLGYSGG